MEKRFTDQVALEVQSKLLENFIRLVRSSQKQGMLAATLQKTIDLSVEIAGAENGSLFLLDDTGMVTDCIIMQKSSIEERRKLVGTVLDKGLAGWVARNRTMGVVADTRHDNRWIDLKDQPYRVRSAMAVPIRNGQNLFGVLSLVHSLPQRFTSETAEIISATADHIAIVLENAQLYSRLDTTFRSLEKAKTQIETYSNALDMELQKGHKMQRSFLPESLPRITGWEIGACLHPAKQVSGDFYDIFRLPGNCLGLVIADVCDKGVSAALFMGIFRSLIHVYLEDLLVKMDRTVPDNRPTARTIHETTQVTANRINHYIENHHGREGIFATLFFGVLDTDRGELYYFNAGHEPLLRIKANRQVDAIKPTGPAIGIAQDAVFGSAHIQLEDGDTLIGFTDGVIDACPGDGAAFGREGVLSVIDRTGCIGRHLMQAIIAEAQEHLKSAELTDDIAMISVLRQA